MKKQTLASLLGWTPAQCHNLTNSCNHKHTDGTHRCLECGTTSLSFDSSASHWIDKHTDKLVELILKDELFLLPTVHDNPYRFHSTE